MNLFEKKYGIFTSAYKVHFTERRNSSSLEELEKNNITRFQIIHIKFMVMDCHNEKQNKLQNPPEQIPSILGEIYIISHIQSFNMIICGP